MDETDLFLRGLWKSIPDEDDASWVQRVAQLPVTSEPLGDFGEIVREMLQKGVSAAAIARFAKLVGYETAFGICYHLDDPHASYEGFGDKPQEVAWGVFSLDPATDEPASPLEGLHERLLSSDPTGREMCPLGKVE